MTEVKVDPRAHTTDYVHTEDGRAHAFLGNPVLDSLVNAVVALGAELWAMKRRSKIVESLAAAKRLPTAEAIEHYLPTPEEEAAWAAERREMIKMTYGMFATAGLPTPDIKSN